MFKVTKESASMLTRDQVRLDADIYRPVAEGTFPVLLMRQPYGRAIASTVVYAHPSWYAAHGYIVVIQDVRGRGTSEGEFHLFTHEIEDGYDTVFWAANLPGSSGEVGMYGFSYQGMTQLYAAIEQPAPLKTLCPAMLGYDLYADWAYEGGAFCLQANLSWAIQLAAETVRLKGNKTAHHTLATAAKNLSFCGTVPTQSGILKTLAPDSFYHEWLNHPEPGEYWEKLSPRSLLGNVDLPMLHIGGWFDVYMRGTLNLYRAMVERSRHPQHLIAGPWAHIPWGRRVGAMDYGYAAGSICDRAQLQWFDYFLKGINNGILSQPVRLFEMGRNHWRSFERFPTPTFVPYFLASTGLASIDEQDGILAPAPPLFPSSHPDTIVHDPWRPVPSLGGHASIPAGAFERSSLDCRTDVLTYTTAPLTQDLHLTGTATVLIHCTADTPSFDLCAVLSEVQPNGNVYNFAQGYRRINPGEPTNPVEITLQPTCICLRQGNSLRLSLSATCFPAYPVNAGNGNPPGQTRLIDQQVITVTIYSGSNRPSQVRLPQVK
jgi:putative CocE/NonD family hydrolase